MKKLSVALLVVVGLSVMSVALAQADPIVVGNPLWYAFFAGEAGTPSAFAVGSSIANSTNPGNPPWTYSAATATSVKITDSFTAGDMYRLYDFGSFIGDTSTVPTTAIGTNNPNPDADYLDPRLSHGIFILPAGNHALTIEIIQNVATLTEAIGFFRVDPAPLPAGIWLLGSGLLGLAGWRRFRKA